MAAEEAKVEIQSQNQYDVIIVGAGFAGLSAALYLKDCNINNILVLEANDRIGGRVQNEYVTIDNKQCQVDVGGAYVGYGQNRLLKMAQRFNVGLYKFNSHTGNVILNDSGRISILDNTMGIIRNIWNFIDMNYVIQKLNKLTSEFDKNNIQQNKEYDSITFKNWIEITMAHNKFVQRFFCAIMETAVCCEASQISLLYVIEAFHSAGGSFESVADTAQTHKFHGGSHSIAVKVMEEINKNGDKIKLNHAVTSINNNTVKCNNGTIFRGKYVMVCIPPNRYKSIQFNPPLSWERTTIANQMIQGHAVKFNIYYKTAFWKDKGFGPVFSCGENINDQNVIQSLIDDTKPDGSFPSLMGILCADRAIEYTTNYTKEERKDIILKQCAKLYDDQRGITECIGYIEKIWHNEEYIGGGYSAIPRIGCLSQPIFGKIYQSEEDRLYFACTELAVKWESYIDGAIERGQREANKIAKLLSNDNNEIKVVEFNENEPDPINSDIDKPDNSTSWIQRNFPNSKQIQNSILVTAVAAGVYYQFRKQ